MSQLKNTEEAGRRHEVRPEVDEDWHVTVSDAATSDISPKIRTESCVWLASCVASSFSLGSTSSPPSNRLLHIHHPRKTSVWQLHTYKCLLTRCWWHAGNHPPNIHVQVALLSQRGHTMLHVCQQLVSIVQYIEWSLLLLVTSASDLPLRTIKFCSVLFSSSWSSMLQAMISRIHWCTAVCAVNCTVDCCNSCSHSSSHQSTETLL